MHVFDFDKVHQRSDNVEAFLIFFMMQHTFLLKAQSAGT